MTVQIPSSGDPSLALIFNDRSGPGLVQEIVERAHAFVRFETMTTRDETDAEAFLLVIWCETAGPDALMELVAGRLPDYVRARRFPLSRWTKLRR